GSARAESVLVRELTQLAQRRSDPFRRIRFDPPRILILRIPPALPNRLNRIPPGHITIAEPRHPQPPTNNPSLTRPPKRQIPGRILRRRCPQHPNNLPTLRNLKEVNRCGRFAS